MRAIVSPKLTGTVLLFLAGTLAADPFKELVRPTEALSPDQEGQRLQVPEGFSIGLFAAEPMIHKPVNIAFDERGRLWVTSTAEYPYAAPRERWKDEQGTRIRDSRDAIRILEDTDGDGRADKVTVFADGLNIPTGVLPWRRPGDHAGCIAWSIPNIWYFGDRDGDGVADTRDVLFGPLGWERDVHGNCSSFRLGPDGWIYATHGFNNTSHFEVRPERLAGRKPGDPGTALELHSGNVFRFRPDGSAVEIWSHGQVNPFGLAWDRRGNLYSADCHSAPIYQLLRGAVYPSFGKPHHGLGFGPEMMRHNHDSTGICGIVCIDDGRWGAEWDGSLLIGNVVTSRINANRLHWHGATPEAVEQPDFLISGDPWFRPVDLQFGPDGALYVADFYNRIIGHYEVPLEHPGRDRDRGRIWRIVKNGPPAPLTPPDEETTRILALRRQIENPSDRAAALDALKHGSAPVQKAAAEFFQCHPGEDSLAPLLALARAIPPEDTVLLHTVRLALREHLRQSALLALLDTEHHLIPPDWQSLLMAVPTPHAATWLLAALERGSFIDHPAALAVFLARHLPEDSLPSLIPAFQEIADTPAGQAALLAALHTGLVERGNISIPATWRAHAGRLAEALLETLPTPEWRPMSGPAEMWVNDRRHGPDGAEHDMISSLDRAAHGGEQRTGILRSRTFSLPPRLTFLLCGHRGPPGEDAHGRNLIRLIDATDGKTIASAFPPRNDQATEIVWDLAAHTGREAWIELVDGDNGDAYAWLAAGRFDPPLVSTILSGGEIGKHLAFLAGLLPHTAPAALRDRLQVWLPEPAPPPATAPVTPEQRAALNELIQSRAAAWRRAPGDAARGKAAFAAFCAACHQYGNDGALVAPQLDGIAPRGVERLIEDIVDPHRNVDSHFRLHLVKMKDGRTLAGMLRGKSGAALLLVDASGQESRVAEADIEHDEETGLSLMPAGLGDVIPENQLLDLLAYLGLSP